MGSATGEPGGARAILATAPSADAITGVVDGLGRNGTLVLLAGIDDPIRVAPLQLISGRKSIRGWPGGDAHDSEETLEFSARNDVRPRIEAFPLAEAADAYDRMIQGEVRFRSVLRVA